LQQFRVGPTIDKQVAPQSHDVSLSCDLEKEDVRANCFRAGDKLPFYMLYQEVSATSHPLMVCTLDTQHEVRGSPSLPEDGTSATRIS